VSDPYERSRQLVRLERMLRDAEDIGLRIGQMTKTLAEIDRDTHKMDLGVSTRDAIDSLKEADVEVTGIQEDLEEALHELHYRISKET
jgi:hypothetical protein